MIENPIVADNRQILELGLGDQHPIEGVTVVAGQHSGTYSVVYRDGKILESQLRKVAVQIEDQVVPGRQLSQSHFRRDLPCRDGADKDLILPIFDYTSGFCAQ